MPEKVQESLGVYLNYWTIVLFCESTKNGIIYLSAQYILSSFDGNYKQMYQWDAHLDLGL